MPVTPATAATRVRGTHATNKDSIAASRPQRAIRRLSEILHGLLSAQGTDAAGRMVLHSGAVGAAVVATVSKDLCSVDGRGHIAGKEEGDVSDLIGRDLLAAGHVPIARGSDCLERGSDLCHSAIHQWSRRVADADNIRPDPILRILDANAPSEDCSCALACKVAMALVAHAKCHSAAKGCELHDVPLLLFLEHWQECVDEIEVGIEVQGNVLVPLLLRHLGKTHGQRCVDARVDHHVHLAVLIEHSLQQLLALGHLRAVCCVCHALLALVQHRLRHGLAVLRYVGH
mmetsp:Transcript_22464/g.46594  ORF Transcript_22464/g.46594 Transcript_22464/m.46594 type:complete len:287 (+) Transcript_22464:84-944(+)